MKDLVDASEIMQMFGINRKTVWVWMKERGMPYMKVGRILRFDPEEVKKWFAEYSSEE